MKKNLFSKTMLFGVAGLTAISLSACNPLDFFSGGDASAEETPTEETDTTQASTEAENTETGDLNVAKVIVSEKPWYGYLDLFEDEQPVENEDTVSTPTAPPDGKDALLNSDDAVTQDGQIGDQGAAQNLGENVGQEGLVEGQESVQNPDEAVGQEGLIEDQTQAQPSNPNQGSDLSSYVQSALSKKPRYWLVDDESDSEGIDLGAARDSVTESNSSSSLSDFVSGAEQTESEDTTDTSSGNSGLSDWVNSTGSSATSSEENNTNNKDDEPSSLTDIVGSDTDTDTDAGDVNTDIDTNASSSFQGRTLPTEQFDIANATDLYQISCSINVQGVSGLTAQALLQVTRGSDLPESYSVDFELSEDQSYMMMTCSSDPSIEGTLWVDSGTTPVLTLPLDLLLGDLAQSSEIRLPLENEIDIRLAQTTPEAESSATVIDILTGDVGVVKQSIFEETTQVSENSNGVTINGYTLVHDDEANEWRWVRNDNIINADKTEEQ